LAATDPNLLPLKQIAAAMVATVNISAAVQIDPLYSSGGANVHSHLINGSLGLLGRYLDRFSRFFE